MTLRFYPHPDLVTPVSSDELPCGDTVRKLTCTMENRLGVAIAANQMGYNGRYWIMNRPESDVPVCIVNATVTLLGPFKRMSEGCLSLPKQFAEVARSENVRVQGTRINTESLEAVSFDEVWTGLDAQIAQHENDHLNGKLFIDYLTSVERSRIKGNLAKLKKQGKL